MLNLKSYICSGGKKLDTAVVEQKLTGGVAAVYISGSCEEGIDPDFGAGIDITADDVQSWVADYRHSEYWCRPEWGSDFADIPDETQGLIYQKTDGGFGVIMPVVSEQYKCVLCGGDSGTVCAKLFSWYDDLNSIDALAFVYAEGENPYKLLEQCAKTALTLLNNGCRIRAQRVYPEIFEYLGWCSWDAMEIRVCEEDLIKKAKEFNDKNIPVKWAIIDDMWAEVHDFYDAKYDSRSEMFRLMHSSRLYSFNADPIRFPNGLKHCIDAINDYGIKVGMWHPTTGYWKGADPDGDICRDMKDCLIKTDDGRYIHSYEEDKAYKFYKAFHDYLSESGAEFIKIDNQSMTRRFYKGLAPVGEAARGFHKAMERSADEHFGNNIINCMGMASEDMWNRSKSPVSRCSDDFLPEDSAWFTKHILQCSFNDLIQGQFYYCDWDMWWTDDAQALKNSVLRAVSGGPIYVSDKLERSKREILMPLVLEDGKILRCDRPAMPSADCLVSDPTSSGRIFKVQNTCGKSGVIAVFNLDDDNAAVCGTVSPGDIDGLCGEEFALYEHFSKTVSILKADEVVEVVLSDRKECRLYVAVPVTDGIAVIGRTDKFISPKTVKSVSGEQIELVEPGEYAYVKDGKLIIKNV